MMNISRPALRTSIRATQCFIPSSRNPPGRRQIANLCRTRLRRIPLQAHCQPLQQCGCTRTIRIGIKSKETIREQFSKAAKDSPFSFWLAVTGIGTALVLLGYTNYKYITYAVGAFQHYPEPVAKEMRKAVFYTNIQLDAERALKYYRRALERCQELRISPFTDQVLGIKVQVARLMQKIGHDEKAAELLAATREQCLDWLRMEGAQHVADGHRSRVLAKTVALGVLLADIYSDRSVGRDDDAEEVLVSVVETVLREQQRRREEGVKDGEGPWVSDEEAGASFETLAHQYEKTGRHHLAAPLFLQALSHCPPRSCHAVVLMNNVATCLAQQNPPASFFSSSPSSSSSPGNPRPGPAQTPPSLKTLAHQASLWAQKAVALAQSITPADGRTEECDEGCAAAMHNLAEFREMEGDLEGAREGFEKVAREARARGDEDGARRAEAGVERVRAKMEGGG